MMVNLDVVLVAASGNYGNTATINHFPAMWGDPALDTISQHIPSLIVVGATDRRGIQWSGSSFAPYITTFAPGADLHLPTTKDGPYSVVSGTSFGEFIDHSMDMMKPL
jgi:subtilisin family serine protease